MPKNYVVVVKNAKTGQIIRVSDQQDYGSAMSTQKDWIRTDARTELKYLSRSYAVLTTEQLAKIRKTGRY